MVLPMATEKVPHLTSFLDSWAEKTPDKAALVWAFNAVTGGGARTTSWAELRARVSRLAGSLGALGLMPGTNARLFVLDKNHSATVELLLAAAWAGVTCVVGNFRLAPDEIAWAINDSSATVLFVGADLAELAAKLRPGLTHVEQVICVDGPRDGLEALVAGGPAVERAAHAPEDCVLQLYTSGTTGFPKGAMLTHRGLLAHSEAMVPLFRLDSTSVSLVPMPLFHVGGSSWALVSLLAGATSVITREPTPRALLDAIAQYRVTHTFIVPAILQGLLATPGLGERDLSSLHAIAYGASPISVPVLEATLKAFSCQFLQVYGMTEMSGVFSALEDDAHRDAGHPERLASAGRVTRGVELRVVDPVSGLDVVPGTLGEFWVRSEQMMKGYWNQPEATTAAFAADGWLRTGDAGVLDAGGFLFIQDRIKDMVISGGENVYPAEIERVLQTHPGIADVAVFGVPDPRWGESLRAAVVRQAGDATTPAELTAFCRARLAGYKCPRHFDFIAALPRNASGKVLKRELRAPFWEGQTRKL